MIYLSNARLVREHGFLPSVSDISKELQFLAGFPPEQADAIAQLVTGLCERIINEAVHARMVRGRS